MFSKGREETTKAGKYKSGVKVL